MPIRNDLRAIFKAFDVQQGLLHLYSDESLSEHRLAGVAANSWDHIPISNEMTASIQKSVISSERWLGRIRQGGYRPA
jgi:hypothetical protein